MRIAHHFSNVHLQSAKSLANEAKQMEEALAEGRADSYHKEETPTSLVHDGYAASSIISSWAFLEAWINEFYNSMIQTAGKEDWDEPPATAEQLIKRVFLAIDEVEPRDYQRKPTLQKYQLLLAYTGHEPFNEGEAPYQSARTIKDLRNDLVHFEPEAYDIEEGPDIQPPGNLPSNLTLNPFHEDRRPLASYLSYDVANWCVEAAAEFALSFQERMGMEERPDIEGLRDIIDE